MKTERTISLVFTELTDSPTEVQLPSTNILAPQMYQFTELPSPPLSPLSPRDQVYNGMICPQSYSVFESPNNCSNRNQYHRQKLVNPDKEKQDSICKHTVIPDIVMSAQDWNQVQTHINSLEGNLSHISRTNELLYHELDMVNSQMRKLTSQESESSRNEYEFLVQQIDLLHRQLQLAQRSQMGHANDGYRKESIQSEQPDTTKQLQSEIKELTKSLKNWQIAFQQAEEKYRRKCDGERTLKQTLRKRETQLFSLVEKLNRYEMECESSIANNKGQLQQSSELEESPYSKSEISEDKKQPTESSKLTTSVPNETIPLSSEKNSGDKKHVSRTLPKEYVEERVTITKGQLVMAIFSWAVAYVLP